MKFIGHADYKSMKPYIDIAEKAKTDAVDAMEKALGGEELNICKSQSHWVKLRSALSKIAQCIE